MRKQKRNSSWQNVNKWYSNKVGEKGLYFHEHVIFPNLIDLMDCTINTKVLDLGCGDGVLTRNLPRFNKYLGFDLSKDLIETAISKNVTNKCEFRISDVSREIKEIDSEFDIATIILALQNIENYVGVFKNAFKALKNGGKFYIVINHPYFRIPKSTAWGIDTQTGFSYRAVYRYMSEHKIRIDMTPGSKAKKEYTYSFHRSLSDYINGLNSVGFVVSGLYEWISDKESKGKYAQNENFIRKEIPMFMCIECQKAL